MPHQPSETCLSARLAGGRAPLAVELEIGVLAALDGHDWVPCTDLLAMAPEGRIVVIPELDGEDAFGADYGHGGAYDGGPSGFPDGRMLEDVLEHLGHRELLTEERYGGGRALRLFDPAEPVGLDEIGDRLGVQRGTVDRWRQRRVLPPPEPTTVGGRPWWRWDRIRAWAFETGRTATSRKTVAIQAMPVPARPDRMPEPLPEGAVWDDVRHLESFTDPKVQAWVRQRVAEGCGLLLVTLAPGYACWGMYGKEPYHVKVTDDLDVTVTPDELASIRGLSKRGWQR